MRTLARIVLGTTLALLVLTLLSAAVLADWFAELRSGPRPDDDATLPQESLS